MILADIDYELKGAIIHSGTMLSGGHYWANLYFSNGQVLNCNDMEISRGSKMAGLSYTFLFEKASGRSNLSQIPPQFSFTAENSEHQSKRVQPKRKAKEATKEKTTFSKEYNDRTKRSKKSGSNTKRSRWLNSDSDNSFRASSEEETSNNGSRKPKGNESRKRKQPKKRTTEDKQESIKAKRQELLDSFKNEKTFEGIFKGNEILENGKEMMQELKKWSMSQKCKICEESWFDQKIFPDIGMCNRCRKESKSLHKCSFLKFKTCPPFSLYLTHSELQP